MLIEDLNKLHVVAIDPGVMCGWYSNKLNESGVINLSSSPKYKVSRLIKKLNELKPELIVFENPRAAKRTNFGTRIKMVRNWAFTTCILITYCYDKKIPFQGVNQAILHKWIKKNFPSQFKSDANDAEMIYEYFSRDSSIIYENYRF